MARPQITLKLATSLDGKIALKNGMSEWITSSKSREYGRKLRSKYDAILIGSNTAVLDNPQLTTRIDGENDPIRIVFDTNLRISEKSNLVLTAKKVPVWIFSNVISGKKFEEERSLCGQLGGGKKNAEARFLFASIQTLSREATLHSFERDAFDYIIIDEFHHARAPTYEKVIDYFQPKFLLGLTATPERMDGQDVLALCDHNIALEVRLHDALELEFLAPFHYFGVADDVTDYNNIKSERGNFVEKSLVKSLYYPSHIISFHFVTQVTLLANNKSYFSTASV